MSSEVAYITKRVQQKPTKDFFLLPGFTKRRIIVSKHIIQAKNNTVAAARSREDSWQNIADSVNVTAKM